MSSSLAQVIGRRGLRVAGGNHVTIRGAIEQAGLDTSHFGGQAWSKGVSRGPSRPLDDYLSHRFPISSYRLKMRLLAEEVFEPRCNNCDGVEWTGQPMPLELEHRDGNSNNKRAWELGVAPSSLSRSDPDLSESPYQA